MNAPIDALISGAPPRPIITAGAIRRIRWNESDRRTYTREHLNALTPAIVLGAIDHRPARRKWTPEFFKSRYGELRVTVDGVG